ncbi:uncharacterized protein IL334_007866 [Kwoniella shivajii]|uniref:Uncharacterized protein n=1 Tax=Kwoniella shivajii TaxID=564305 RepID=A0ABZ1D9V4_9TREE|nr:hypothetical protein IL334_007866 [Kwoniella shivajii]
MHPYTPPDIFSNSRSGVPPSYPHSYRPLPRNAVPSPSPRARHESIPEESQPRFPPPSSSPLGYSPYHPRDDLFSISQHSTLPTPPSSGAYRLPSPPIVNRATRVDHYHPEDGPSPSRASTGRASTSTPRTAQDIYEEGRQKKVTGVDKILAKLTEMSGHITTLSHDISALKNDNIILKNDNINFRNDNRQLRDKLHELSLGQKAIATRNEITEEIGNQLSTPMNDNLQVYLDKLETLPETIALSLKSKLEDTQVFKNSKDAEASSSLLNQVLSKFNEIDKFIYLLQPFKDLPQAIIDVVVFKDALQALTAKVEDSSQQSALAHQHTFTSSHPVSHPASISIVPSISSEAMERLEPAIQALHAAKTTFEDQGSNNNEMITLLHTLNNGQNEVKSFLRNLSSSKSTSGSAIRQRASSTEHFEPTQQNSLNDLAIAAATQARMEETQAAQASTFMNSTSTLDPFAAAAVESWSIGSRGSFGMSSLKKPRLSSTDPSDRPITRSMSGRTNAPDRWSPSFHATKTTCIKNRNSPTTSSRTLAGQSKEEPIEISSGSGDSSQNVGRQVRRRGRPKKQVSAISTQESSILNSEIESLPVSLKNGLFLDLHPQTVSQNVPSTLTAQNPLMNDQQAGIRELPEPLETHPNKGASSSIASAPVETNLPTKRSNGKRKMEVFDDSLD